METLRKIGFILLIPIFIIPLIILIGAIAYSWEPLD